ncbi:class I adenylate-forming enzyme family protein [Streptomyces albiaxialis]|uniref:Class I adenylate-forming enzyme family protein n=1 Tax=Streptomyces albiaxialis TaxID=329523 RepID=A0ABN2VYN7_9ACTN
MHPRDAFPAARPAPGAGPARCAVPARGGTPVTEGAPVLGAAGRRTVAAPRAENAAEAFLGRAAALHAAAPAVRDGAGAWTYATLDAASRTFALRLAERGVRPGDRVLVRLGAVREFVAALYGTWRLGAVFVPVGPDMRPFHLRAVLEDVRPALALVVPGEREGVDGMPWPARCEVLALDELDLSWPGPDDPPEDPAPPVPADRPALLLPVSGPGPVPRAVVCPHAQVAFAARAVAARLGYRRDDVVLSALPLASGHGLQQVPLCALAGAELSLYEGGAGDGSGLLARAREHGATVLPLEPSLGAPLVRRAARDRRRTRVRLLTGTGDPLGAPLTASLRAAFPGARVALVSGGEECQALTVLEPDGDLAHPGSLGPALPGTRVLALDGGGRPLDPYEIGEIAARGPHVMAGYRHAPGATARHFRPAPDGTVTLRTGQYGWLDEDGHLYVQGRRDGQFRRHGTRTGAAEIEAAALDVEGVRHAVLLVPGEGGGMALFTVGPATEDEVRAGLAARLEAAKVPGAGDCHVLDALPRAPDGTADRARLGALLRALRARRCR